MGDTITSTISVPKSKQEVAQSLLGKLQHLISVAEPEELERIDKSLQPTLVPAKETDLAKEIAGEYYHPERLLELQLANLQRVYDRKRELLQDSITSTEVVELIRCANRSTVKNRREAGKLIGLKNGRGYSYPTWQFDPEGSEGVVEGLPEVIGAMDEVSDFAKLNWLSSPHAVFDGQTPIQKLKQGEVKAVVIEARAVRISM